MPDHALLDQLLNSFPKSNKEDWSRAASKEISQKNPLEQLTWKTDDKINFLPYYDSSDNSSLEYIKKFELHSSATDSTGARSWQSLPKVFIPSIKTANAVALSHLENGADGILFECDDFFSPDLDELLSEIHLPSCNVSFLLTHTAKLIQDIIEFAKKKNYDPELVTGTIFCKSARDIKSSQLQTIGNYKGLRTLGEFQSRDQLLLRKSRLHCLRPHH